MYHYTEGFYKASKFQIAAQRERDTTIQFKFCHSARTVVKSILGGKQRDIWIWLHKISMDIYGYPSA